MKYSMKEPEVLGKAIEIPTGPELVDRTQQVLAVRTLEWSFRRAVVDKLIQL